MVFHREEWFWYRIRGLTRAGLLGFPVEEVLKILALHAIRHHSVFFIPSNRSKLTTFWVEPTWAYPHPQNLDAVSPSMKRRLLDLPNFSVEVPPPFSGVEFPHRSGATEVSNEVHWTRFCGYPDRRCRRGYFIGPLRASVNRLKSVRPRIRYRLSKEIGWDL